MDIRKKSIEQLQAELEFESEALATLQSIYADKVKQVRTNTLLPPDIQTRFLAEWETFYQQRLLIIFKNNLPIQSIPLTVTPPSPPLNLPLPPPPPPVIASPLLQNEQLAPEAAKFPPAEAANSAVQPTEDKPTDEVDLSNFNKEVSFNTDSWVNPAESLDYEPYEASEADDVRAEEPPYNQPKGNFPPTSGLKGLTSFMDFDIKKKK
ncbi:MAG: hypothetical protein RMM17_13855 [Acidobacteriota bacterium]|nr:hypothetical protein [Blastocatellia bacterium]MDW8413752.1 hypothetical protein [Acidobacteriota bacterium]